MRGSFASGSAMQSPSLFSAPCSDCGGGRRCAKPGRQGRCAKRRDTTTHGDTLILFDLSGTWSTGNMLTPCLSRSRLSLATTNRSPRGLPEGDCPTISTPSPRISLPGSMSGHARSPSAQISRHVSAEPPQNLPAMSDAPQSSATHQLRPSSLATRVKASLSFRWMAPDMPPGPMSNFASSTTGAPSPILSTLDVPIALSESVTARGAGSV
eukprot:7302477-Prymnesium_polylepis.2